MALRRELVHVTRAWQACEVGRIAGSDASLESALEVARRADDDLVARRLLEWRDHLAERVDLRSFPRAQDGDRRRRGRGHRRGARRESEQRDGREAEPARERALREARH